MQRQTTDKRDSQRLERGKARKDRTEKKTNKNRAERKGLNRKKAPLPPRRDPPHANNPLTPAGEKDPRPCRGKSRLTPTTR